MIEEKDIVEAIPKTLQDTFLIWPVYLGQKIDQARDLVRDLTCKEALKRS